MRAALRSLAVSALAACGGPTAAPPDCTTNEQCSDGIYCNGEETCDPYIGACVSGVAVRCADAVACTVEQCDEEADACVITPDSTRCGPRESCDAASGCTLDAACRALDSSYGAAITLTAAAAIPDTTFTLTLDTASLVAAGKLQSDCDDLRVTRADGTALPFWVDNCNTASSQLIVRITDVTAGASTVLLNYGNPSAASTRNFNGTFLAFWDFEQNDLDGWTLGVMNHQPGHDDAVSVSPTTVVKMSGSYALQVRADASCFGDPFDGVGAYVERAFAPAAPYCVELDWRADITGFQFDSSAQVTGEVIASSAPVIARATTCSGEFCTATGTWARGATTAAAPGGTLRLQGSASDCADGNVYFDNVRVRTCVSDAALTVTLGAELDCTQL